METVTIPFAGLPSQSCAAGHCEQHQLDYIRETKACRLRAGGYDGAVLADYLLARRGISFQVRLTLSIGKLEWTGGAAATRFPASAWLQPARV